MRVADLVRELGVSDMTVRRDLEILQERGLLEKVHGGAMVTTGSALFEPGFAAKSALQEPEKHAIAEAAVRPGRRPASRSRVSAGTTTYALAARLVDIPGLTVVTNSVPVAEVLYRGGRPDQTIILTGGVRTPSDALVGPVRRRRAADDPRRPRVHGRPRDGPALRLHDARTCWRRRRTGPSSRRAAGSSSSPTTRSGASIGISSIARLDQADVLVTDVGLRRRAQTIRRRAACASSSIVDGRDRRRATVDAR